MQHQLVIGMGLFFVGTAQAADLATYRALYELQTLRADSRGGTVPIDGRIGYEVSGSECAGITVDSRFVTRFADAEEGNRIVNNESTTVETSDGLSLKIDQKQVTGKNLDSEDHITVNRAKSGEEASVVQTGSKPDKFKVSGDTLFPTSHQKKLLAKAAAGETRDVSMLYDGSSGNKAFRVVTFIGKKREPGSYQRDKNNPSAATLLGMASWPFQLGYYTTGDSQSDAPVYQANFNMYENGITTELVFDYGTYSLAGKLVKLEMTQPKACDGKTAP